MNLDQLSLEGSEILKLRSSTAEASKRCANWISNVAEYLVSHYPNSGYVPEWLSLDGRQLNTDHPQAVIDLNWPPFAAAIQARLSWLGNLPSKFSLDCALGKSFTQTIKLQDSQSSHQSLKKPLIDYRRISELKSLRHDKYPLDKLIAVCEEINECFVNDCYYAVISLTRMIVDYVPPIFDQPNFESVVSQSQKSAKAVLEKLSGVAKHLADIHLHKQATSSESHPTSAQVDFSAPLDYLLQMICERLKQAN
jgi:hypothetical protein